MFLLCICYKTIAQAAYIPGRFVLTRTAPAVELLCWFTYSVEIRLWDPVFSGSSYLNIIELIGRVKFRW